jgi:hypothetical protein
MPVRGRLSQIESSPSARDRAKGARIGRERFHARHWTKLPKTFLFFAIQLIGVAELRASPVERSRYRARRLRAVACFRHRFGDAPMIQPYVSYRIHGGVGEV